MGKKINIQVAYANQTKQEVLFLSVDPSCSAIEAIKQSNIMGIFSELNLDNLQLGVFGNLIPETYTVEEGDRIEIYRPLTINPKESRRQRAEQAKKSRSNKQRQ